jgi:uncharacterized integral membrane protein
MQIGVIFSLFLGVIITFFAVLNTEIITLKYYFGIVEISVALLVLASAICGALAIGLLSFFKQVRTGLTIWGFRNKSMRLGKEVESLKDQTRASTDDLAFLQAEYESKIREKETEYESKIREKETEYESKIREKEAEYESKIREKEAEYEK